ncbi:phosphate acyltransferase [Symbiobacterium terraclitae]|uniref:phosphate acyltransferase n=1 Tax=Symbiobacterium terraclitae TaxID=557451 RepID=UPI0035B52286
MITSLDQLIPAARQKVAGRPLTMAVAQATDPHVEEAVAEAERLGLVRGLRFVRENPAEAAQAAVAAVRSGGAQLLMKGLVQTADIMRAVLNRDNGLRTGRALSHACVVQVPGWPRLLHITDIALNVAPDLSRKADILRNQVQVAHALGNPRPKVAVIAAVETVNPDMAATVDARALQEMAERGELGECVVQGPLALDLALSAEAGATKGVSGPVVGAADVLLMPDLEAGNVLYKGLVCLAGADSAGIVVGARCPIVLLSRSDSAAAKLNSIALAVLAAFA